MDPIQEMVYSLPFIAIASAILAYVMATRFNLYPVIIYVSKTKNLMDEPEERRVHANKVPNLGGMGLFITFSLTLLLFVPFLNNTVSDLSNLLSLLSSTIILLFLGVKDDLVLMTPKKKLVIQLIAVSMVCVLQDVRITDFHGLLGVGELSYLVSILFTVFVFVLVINSVNLIDGIDGLAASISILASLGFGIAFFIANDFLMTVLSAVLIGSLLGFLKYNFSDESKIFMGDCGSLIVGFLLAYQGIKFININPENVQFYNSNNSSILLLAILSYPLFDLLRVFIVRIMQKKSPFIADNNHIHHRLLRLGLNHKQATFFLFVSNLTLMVITFFTSDLQINLNLIVVVCFGCLLYLLPFLSVFEEFKENEILAEIPSSKQNEFSNDNLISKASTSENKIDGGVIRLMNLEKSSGVKSVFETQNKNLTPERVKEIKTWAGVQKSSMHSDSNKV